MLKWSQKVEYFITTKQGCSCKAASISADSFDEHPTYVQSIPIMLMRKLSGWIVFSHMRQLTNCEVLFSNALDLCFALFSTRTASLHQ